MDRGQQSPAAGARTPVWLATLPTAASPTGGMFGNHLGLNLAEDAQLNSAGVAMMECAGWW